MVVSGKRLLSIPELKCSKAVIDLVVSGKRLLSIPELNCSKAVINLVIGGKAIADPMVGTRLLLIPWPAARLLLIT